AQPRRISMSRSDWAATIGRSVRLTPTGSHSPDCRRWTLVRSRRRSGSGRWSGRTRSCARGWRGWRRGELTANSYQLSAIGHPHAVVHLVAGVDDDLLAGLQASDDLGFESGLLADVHLASAGAPAVNYEYCPAVFE